VLFILTNKLFVMAKMESAFPFTGTIDNMSFYKMRGVEGVIGRKKGGPTSKRVKESKTYQNTRRNSTEFGGRSTASKWLINMMAPLKALADHNIAGELNKMLRPVQQRDVTSEWGGGAYFFQLPQTLWPGSVSIIKIRLIPLYAARYVVK
jgi:hypothetical protein